MQDLEVLSGLPMGLDDLGRIVFGPDVVVEDTAARTLKRLRPVALEPQACHGDEIAYYMYNGVYRQNDADRLADVPLRYELTVIPPRRIGREFVKTSGHLHNAHLESGVTYAEVCEVLVGTAHFLFQTLDTAGPSTSAAFYVEAEPGQKIIIPPGLDHLCINPGPDLLLFADLIARSVTPIYDRFSATRGAAYLEVAADGRRQFMANPVYRAVPPLRRLALADYPALRLTRHVPLYTAFVQGRGENWPFLTDPRRFRVTFPDLERALQS